MSELKGLEDRLIKKGSPKSVNNGSVPTTANLAPGIIPINNTFSKGKYEDYVLRLRSYSRIRSRFNR